MLRDVLWCKITKTFCSRSDRWEFSWIFSLCWTVSAQLEHTLISADQYNDTSDTSTFCCLTFLNFFVVPQKKWKSWCAEAWDFSVGLARFEDGFEGHKLLHQAMRAWSQLAGLSVSRLDGCSLKWSWNLACYVRFFFVVNVGIADWTFGCGFWHSFG